jgi:hypothetical protein
MNEDRWLPVVGYEGTYEVSKNGHVRRIGRARGAKPGTILAQRPGRGGYPIVRLAAKRECVTRYIHRLVAAAFLGPCPPGMVVNHKDRNRQNPSAENLEYVTRSDNNRHAYQNGVEPVKGEAKHNAKLTDNSVRDIRASDLGPRELGRVHGVSHHTIVAIRKREKWKHVA